MKQNSDNEHDSATLFARLVIATAQEFELDYDEAMQFIGKACNAGGWPDKEEEPELVEDLRKIATMAPSPKLNPDRPF
jgi:hypothetical protein